MTTFAAIIVLALATAAAGSIHAAERTPEQSIPDAASAVVSGAAALTRQLQSAWSDIQSTLDQILERRDREESLPKASLLPNVFGDTRESNARKIDSLMDRLAQSMLSSPAYENLQGIRELEEKVVVLQARERRLKNEAFSAPVTRPIYRIDVSTADELLTKAEACAAEIEQARKDITLHRQFIADELRSWGVELTPAQQDLLFSSVIGDDMLQNSIILKNVRAVLEQMAAHVAQDSRDPQAPKRYYGSYLAFIDLLIGSNRTTLDNIRDTWLPRLADITNKARETKAAAKRAIVSGELKPQQIKALENNISANDLTLKVGDLYRDFLNRQALAVEKRLGDLQTDRLTSQNTYDTVSVSSNLSELIQRGLQDLDALGGIVLPEMHLFENFEQQKEFAELSNRMAEAESNR